MLWIARPDALYAFAAICEAITATLRGGGVSAERSEHYWQGVVVPGPDDEG
jgi:hypothetical protein